MTKRRTVSRVFVDAAYTEVDEDEGIGRFENADLTIVRGNDLHVWFNGTHYIGQGTADTVEEGDLFIQTTPELFIDKVASVDTSVSTSDPGVTIEHLYGSMVDEDDPVSDKTSVDQLIGEIEDVPMGYTGPPTPLREVER